jgi:hypothetical protein
VKLPIHVNEDGLRRGVSSIVGALHTQMIV